MKKFFEYASLIGIFSLVLLFTACDDKKNSDTLKIACNLPMTGDLSIYGESVRYGVKLAMEELEDSLKLYDIKIEYDFQDNASNAKNAVSIMKSQQLKGFDIYISGITNQTLAIIDEVNKTNSPHFIWSFYPLTLEKGDNLYRTWVDYPKEAEYFIRYLKEQKPEAKKIACLYLDAVSIQELFNKLFIPNVKDEYEVVFSESFDIGTKDFKNLVLKVKQSGADVVFINGWENHLVQIIREAQSQNLKKEGNMVFTFDLLDAINKLDKSSLDGLVANIPLYEIESSDEKDKWKTKFEKVNNKKPNYTSAYAYDFAYVMFEMAKKYKNSKRENFNIEDYIFDINQKGITGNLRFSEEGDLIGVYKTCIYKDGVFHPLN